MSVSYRDAILNFNKKNNINEDDEKIYKYVPKNFPTKNLKFDKPSYKYKYHKSKFQDKHKGEKHKEEKHKEEKHKSEKFKSEKFKSFEKKPKIENIDEQTIYMVKKKILINGWISQV